MLPETAGARLTPAAAFVRVPHFSHAQALGSLKSLSGRPCSVCPVLTPNPTLFDTKNPLN